MPIDNLALYPAYARIFQSIRISFVLAESRSYVIKLHIELIQPRIEFGLLRFNEMEHIVQLVKSAVSRVEYRAEGDDDYRYVL